MEENEVLARLAVIEGKMDEILDFIRTVAAIAGPMLPPGTLGVSGDVPAVAAKPW